MPKINIVYDEIEGKILFFKQYIIQSRSSFAVTDNKKNSCSVSGVTERVANSNLFEQWIEISCSSRGLRNNFCVKLEHKQG